MRFGFGLSLAAKGKASTALGGGGGGGGPVLSPATFTMTQVAEEKSFPRLTETDGGYGKGTGTVPLTLNVVTAGAVYARCRAANGTVVQEPWLVGAEIPTGSRVVPIVGVDASPDYFYLDTSGDGVTWNNGTTLIALGVAVAMVGEQSLGVRMVGAVPAATVEAGDRAADYGITVNPRTAIYGKYTDSARSSPEAAWSKPSQVGTFDSVGIIHLLGELQEQLGVHVYAGVCPVGSTSLEDHVVGGAHFADVDAILTEIGGCEYAMSFIGHTDAGYGHTNRWYRTYLNALFQFVALKNVRGNNFTPIVLTIPNCDPNNFGTEEQKNVIRRAGYDFVKIDCPADYARPAVYVQNYNVDLTEDEVHQTQLGSLDLAESILLGLSGVDVSQGDGTIAPRPVINLNLTDETFTSPGRFLAAGLDGGGGSFDVDGKSSYGTVSQGVWFKRPLPDSMQIIYGTGSACWLAIQDDGHLHLNSGGDTISTNVEYNDGWNWIVLDEDHNPYDGDPTATVMLNGVPVPGLIGVPHTAQTTNNDNGVRQYNGGGYTFDPSTVSEYTSWNKLLGTFVPSAAFTGNEAHLMAYFPLNGSGAGLV